MHPLHPFGQGNELARLGTHNDWNASIDAYAQRNRLGSRYRNNNTRASCRSNFRASSARDKFLPFLSSFLNEFRKVVGISFFFASKTGWNPLYEIVDRAIVTIIGRVLVATYAIGYDKFFFLALSFSSFLLHSFFLLSFPTLSLSLPALFPFFLFHVDVVRTFESSLAARGERRVEVWTKNHKCPVESATPPRPPGNPIPHHGLAGCGRVLRIFLPRRDPSLGPVLTSEKNCEFVCWIMLGDSEYLCPR